MKKEKKEILKGKMNGFGIREMVFFIYKFFFCISVLHS